MHLIVKQIITHLCNIVAKLTNKQKMEMRQEIECMELNQMENIREYLTKMENRQLKLERWCITVKMHDMVVAVVDQMHDSGLFDHKVLCDWEQKQEHEK